MSVPCCVCARVGAAAAPVAQQRRGGQRCRSKGHQRMEAEDGVPPEGAGEPRRCGQGGKWHTDLLPAGWEGLLHHKPADPSVRSDSPVPESWPALRLLTVHQGHQPHLGWRLPPGKCPALPAQCPLSACTSTTHGSSAEAIIIRLQKAQILVAAPGCRLCWMQPGADVHTSLARSSSPWLSAM